MRRCTYHTLILEALTIRCQKSALDKVEEEFAQQPEDKMMDNAAANLVDKMNAEVSASGGSMLHAEVYTRLAQGN